MKFLKPLLCVGWKNKQTNERPNQPTYGIIYQSLLVSPNLLPLVYFIFLFYIIYFKLYTVSSIVLYARFIGLIFIVSSALCMIFNQPINDF